MFYLVFLIGDILPLVFLNYLRFGGLFLSGDDIVMKKQLDRREIKVTFTKSKINQDLRFDFLIISDQFCKCHIGDGKFIQCNFA